MAFDPVTMGIGAGASLLSTTANVVAGAMQARRGRELLKEAERTRPIYKTPKAIEESVRISRMRATNPFLPGQSLIEQGIGQTAATTAGNIMGMGSASDLYGVQMAQNQAMNQLGIQSADQALKNELGLLQWLEKEAEYKNLEFETNELAPSNRKFSAAEAMIGAGMTNIGQGLNTISTMGASLLGMPQSQEQTAKQKLKQRQQQYEKDVSNWQIPLLFPQKPQ